MKIVKKILGFVGCCAAAGYTLYGALGWLQMGEHIIMGSDETDSLDVINNEVDEEI